MDFTSYLHERADESRHNTSLSFSIAILGTVLFVGGILETVMTTTSPQWILFFPYQLTSDPRGLLGIALTVVGVALLILGIGLAIHYASQRVWYIRELKAVLNTHLCFIVFVLVFLVTETKKQLFLDGSYFSFPRGI